MERELAEYDAQIEENASDYQALSRLMEERQALEQALDEKMALWETLMGD